MIPRIALVTAAMIAVASPAPAGADRHASDAAAPAAPGGMLLAKQRGHIVIVELLPGAAAARAGLRRGDVLLAVNGVNLVDLEEPSAAAVVDLVAGSAGSDLRLIIGRGGQTFFVQLARELLDAPPANLTSPEPPRLGERAPDFTAIDMEGRTVRLENLRGGPLLIDFWASWCPPCRASAITLKRFADQFGDRLVIVGVSLDEERGAFEAFVYNHHLPGHQIHDGGPNGPIATLYGAAAAGIPYSVLIGPDGVVLHMGASLQAKEEAISRLLDAAARGDGD